MVHNEFTGRRNGRTQSTEVWKGNWGARRGICYTEQRPGQFLGKRSRLTVQEKGMANGAHEEKREGEACPRHEEARAAPQSPGSGECE